MSDPTWKKRRGQTLVLGVLSLLVLSLMLMLSFSLSNAIHERVRLQSHADAQAFSLATLEARAFNTVGYSNRAIAAALVSEMSLHAWMAIASQVAATLQAAQQAFHTVAAIEQGMCSHHNVHCADAAVARGIGAHYGAEGSAMASLVQGKERAFNTAVKQLTDMMARLHDEQNSILKNVEAQIHDGDVLQALKKKNAPQATFLGVESANIANFACAVESSQIDGHCAGSMPGGKTAWAKAPAEVRSQEMEDASNAVRTPFHRTCTGCYLTDANADYVPMSSHLRGIQLNEGTIQFQYDVLARSGAGYARGSNNGQQLENFGGSTGSMSLSVQWRHGSGRGSRDASIYSDQSGGRHTQGAAHSASHNSFSGFELDAPCRQSSCFVNFRANPDKDTYDFGQPSVYGAVSQQLNVLRSGKERPWELNSDATANVKLGAAGTINLKLKPQGTGVAVAKAKTYFHQFGDWQVAPNLFDPFWRAKLHPFHRRELSDVLSAAGDAAGAQVAKSAPVEGDDR